MSRPTQIWKLQWEEGSNARRSAILQNVYKTDSFNTQQSFVNTNLLPLPRLLNSPTLLLRQQLHKRIPHSNTQRRILDTQDLLSFTPIKNINLLLQSSSLDTLRQPPLQPRFQLNQLINGSLIIKMCTN